MKSIYHGILQKLLSQISPVDFAKLIHPKTYNMLKKIDAGDECDEVMDSLHSKMKRKSIPERDYVTLSIEILIGIADKNKWGLCRNQGEVYCFNGRYWEAIDSDAFQNFLCEAARKMGVPKRIADYYQFGEKLLKQFNMKAYLETPKCNPDIVLINLQNGTYEINNGTGHLREFRQEDFLTYLLPFEYDSKAVSPIFDKFIERVLPDISCQKALAEYIGYTFIRTGSHSIKEEKVLLLYGTGANGKSVFFSVINALLGPENVTNHSLEKLTDGNGYYRAQIANKLINYSSEISGQMDTAIFKQLVSGEPVTARLPYGKPLTLTQYARMVFNVNELPAQTEHNTAFFRRFLIIPFSVTIPPEEQDKTLHIKIINSELAGVFNWVLSGLNRLIANNGFTECDAAEKALVEYKRQSDTVIQFLEDQEFQKSISVRQKIADLYTDYQIFCKENGCYSVSRQKFIKRLKDNGIKVETINIGNVAYIEKKISPIS